MSLYLLLSVALITHHVILLAVCAASPFCFYVYSQIEVVDEEYGTPEVLCRQSLSLVYSTIDEDYPEGTLQLLSDLVMPGYYPPRDIMIHLLCNILLNQKCPHHLCVQAFSLLMRAQK